MEAGTGTKGTAASMSVMKRVTLIFRSKANRALDRMEDPRETLDYSYQRQLEMLQKVRRGVADVATSRKRVELQMNQIQQQSNKLEKQARDALGAGREDLAREALTRRSSAQSQLSDLQAQYASLQAEEEKLTNASQRLQAKVDAFRTRKETIKATYTAAEAQTRINEAFSGISEEMGDVGMAIQRAEDKTAQMPARWKMSRARRGTTSRPSWTGWAPATTSSWSCRSCGASWAVAPPRSWRPARPAAPTGTRPATVTPAGLPRPRRRRPTVCSHPPATARPRRASQPFPPPTWASRPFPRRTRRGPVISRDRPDSGRGPAPHRRPGRGRAQRPGRPADRRDRRR